MANNIVIKESQLLELQSILQLEESLTKTIQELVYLHEQRGLINESQLMATMVDRLKQLYQRGGLSGVRRALQTAAMAGALHALPTGALANAATQAGIPEPEVKSIVNDVERGGGGGNGNTGKTTTLDIAGGLRALARNYVLPDGQSQPIYMKFTGNPSDIIGFGANGYPQFEPGSPSHKVYSAVWSNPQPQIGKVHFAGRDFRARFVEANGLYYTIPEGDTKPTDNIDSINHTSPELTNKLPTANPVPVKIPTSSPNDVPVNPKPEDIYDYTGIFKQAKERFAFRQQQSKGKVVKDNLSGQVKEYAGYEAYLFDFLRSQGKGLRNMSDEQLRSLFSKGLKQPVPKGSNFLSNES